jgi:hypothetical protein
MGLLDLLCLHRMLVNCNSSTEGSQRPRPLIFTNLNLILVNLLLAMHWGGSRDLQPARAGNFIITKILRAYVR